ncbi:hypothetical protein ABT156_39065, partial [Streptomyces sp. NPDC001833]
MGETTIGAAVVCGGVMAWLLAERQREVRRTRQLLACGGVVTTGPPSWEQALGELRRLRGRWRGEWWALAAGVALALLAASVLPVLAGTAGVPVLRRVRLARQARRTRQARADAVIALCGTLAGEVRAGRQPGEALLRAARDSGGLGEARPAVVAAARFGGDVPGAL